MCEQLFSNSECVLPCLAAVPKSIQAIISTTCSIPKFAKKKRLLIFTRRDSRVKNAGTHFVVCSFIKIPGSIVSYLLVIGGAFVPSTAVQQLSKLWCAFEFARPGMTGKFSAQEDSVWNVYLANRPDLDERFVHNHLGGRLECQSGSDVEAVLEILLVVIVSSFLYDPMDRV
jgi:hypothetical protein